MDLIHPPRRWLLGTRRVAAIAVFVAVSVALVGARARESSESLHGGDEARAFGVLAGTALVDGLVGTACVNDRAFDLGTTLTLPDVRWSWACRAEVAIFSRGYAAWVGSPRGVGRGFDRFQPRLRPRVNAWVPLTSAEGVDAMTWANVSIATATAHFVGNSIGMEFGNLTVHEYVGSGEATATAVVDVDGCSGLAGLMEAGPPLYDPAALNVYFIESLPNYSTGYNCVDYGASNVLLISVSQNFATALSHELGHAMGLRHINTTELGLADASRFIEPEANLMYNQTSATAEGLRGHFTLGQAYRMNVDARSWVNKLATSGTSTSSVRRGVTRGCGPPAQGRCPALWQEWP